MPARRARAGADSDAGLFDLGRHVIPCLALSIGRLQVVVNVLEVDADIPTPTRHRLRLEHRERLQAEIAHPARLTLHLRDFGDNLFVEPAAGLEHAVGLRHEIVFIDFTQRQFIGRSD